MTIDGFIARNDGQMDWMTFNWSEDLNEYVTQLTDPVDTILLGRRLAEGFIPHWTAALNQPEPERGAAKMVHTPKVVFSRELTASKWDNTIIANGNLADEVNALKKQPGSDMIVYGGGEFVSSLIREKLIDELNLFINPVAIGKGMPIFQEIADKQNFKPVASKQFECGIIVLTYNLI